MPTTEIAAENWRIFCDDFSKLHQGEIADVQVIGEDLGAQWAIHQRAFDGISFEDSGSEQGDIVLFFGTNTEDEMTHRAESPTKLWHLTGEGSGESLEIEAADHLKILLQLHPGSAATAS